MVYIHSWQEFQVAAEALYVKSPDKVRHIDEKFGTISNGFAGAIFCKVEGFRGKADVENH